MVINLTGIAIKNEIAYAKIYTLVLIVSNINNKYITQVQLHS